MLRILLAVLSILFILPGSVSAEDGFKVFTGYSVEYYDNNTKKLNF
jgi:hypothetical protein